jgi:hypothetical protein
MVIITESILGSLWFVLRMDGVWGLAHTLAAMFFVQFLPFNRRVEFWEDHALDREWAVRCISTDTRFTIPVLNRLHLSSLVLLGKEQGPPHAAGTFLRIIRQAAFSRGVGGGDAAELHQIIDDLTIPDPTLKP